jgi:hypothetical protein
LKHNHPEFKHVLPYSTEALEFKGELVDVDYHKAEPSMFEKEEHDWFLLEKSDG